MRACLTSRTATGITPASRPARSTRSSRAAGNARGTRRDHPRRQRAAAARPRVLPDRRARGLAGRADGRAFARTPSAGASIELRFKDLRERQNFSPRRSRTSRRMSPGRTTTRHAAVRREGRRDPARAVRQEASCSARIRRATHWCSSRPTRASTPGSPSPNRIASSSSHMESTVSSEWRYADADDPALALHACSCRTSATTSTRSSISGDRFVIRTNWQAREFPHHAGADRRGMRRATLGRELVPHRDDTFIQDFDVFERFLAVSRAQRRPAQDQHPAAAPAPARAEFFIEGDEPAYTMALSINPRHRYRRGALRLFLADHADDASTTTTSAPASASC